MGTVFWTGGLSRTRHAARAENRHPAGTLAVVSSAQGVSRDGRDPAAGRWLRSLAGDARTPRGGHEVRLYLEWLRDVRAGGLLARRTPRRRRPRARGATIGRHGWRTSPGRWPAARAARSRRAGVGDRVRRGGGHAPALRGGGGAGRGRGSHGPTVRRARRRAPHPDARRHRPRPGGRLHLAPCCKCRPPGTARPVPTRSGVSPTPGEQLALLDAPLVLAVGSHAARLLLHTERGITSLRGRFQRPPTAGG